MKKGDLIELAEAAIIVNETGAEYLAAGTRGILLSVKGGRATFQTHVDRYSVPLKIVRSAGKKAA